MPRQKRGGEAGGRAVQKKTSEHPKKSSSMCVCVSVSVCVCFGVCLCVCVRVCVGGGVPLNSRPLSQPLSQLLSQLSLSTSQLSLSRPLSLACSPFRSVTASANQHGPCLEAHNVVKRHEFVRMCKNSAVAKQLSVSSPPPSKLLFFLFPFLFLVILCPGERNTSTRTYKSLTITKMTLETVYAVSEREMWCVSR